VKAQRAVVGASLDVIKERRSQNPAARTAARSEAIKAGKEKRNAAQSVKKAEKAKSAAKSASGQVKQPYVSHINVKMMPSLTSQTVPSASKLPRVLHRSRSPLLAKRFG